MKSECAFLLAIPMLLFAIDGMGQDETDQQYNEKLELQKVRDAIVDAYNRQDVDALMANFHPDVGYLVPSRPYVDGWNAVKNMYADVFERFQASNNCGYIKSHNKDVVIAGKWAWVRGESQFIRAECGSTPVFPADLPPGSKHMGIYKKENGRWLRYRQMRNGNTSDMNF